MLKFILLIPFSQFFFSVNGQPDTVAQRKTRRAVLGFYSSGTTVYGDFSKFNNAITTAGYPSVSNQYGGVSFGFSFRRSDRNSYTSMTFGTFRSNPSPVYDINRTKDVRINNLEFSIANHFDLGVHPKWLLYPYFGFGFGSATLTLYDNVNTQPTFALSISNLGAPVSKQWTSGYVFLDAGFGIERKLRVWVYDFYLGGGGGYRLSTSAKFREAYQIYNDVPSAQLSGLSWNFKIRFEIWRHLATKRDR